MFYARIHASILIPERIKNTTHLQMEKFPPIIFEAVNHSISFLVG